MRAPFQVLILPFIKKGKKYYYAIFKRKDLDIWQFIAGGGEGDEKPIEAARREVHEEILIDENLLFVRLASLTVIPAANIHGLIWGKEIIMIPEFAFSVELHSEKLNITNEHTQYLWVNYEEAVKKLKYDSNKSALWELDCHLNNKKFDGIKKNIQIIKRFL